MAHAPSAPPMPEGMDGAHQSHNRHDAPAMPQSKIPLSLSTDRLGTYIFSCMFILLTTFTN